MIRASQAASWAALLLLQGCFDVNRVPGGPPLGYETDELSCSDGRDNDQDGLADCSDPDCIGRWFCGEIIPDLPVEGVENSLRLCIDRIDNDLDGQFDCGDRGCQGIRELCCVTEFSDVSCSDGVDNDGNGFIDCQDFACRNGLFVTVCESETVCDDGLDNDGDRREDCEDEDCARDPACMTGPPPEMGPENTVARCMDGADNDGNNFTDCGDFSCCGNRQCTMPIDPAVGEYCAMRLENTVEKCTDEIDNDDNGFTDCQEFSCCPRDMPCIDPAIDEYCNTGGPEEDTLELCTNGIDDDGDGFLDCDDFSCSEAPGLGDACEASYASCLDGIDNEGDGFVDCSDFSCQGISEMAMPPGATVPVLVSPCLESFTSADPVMDPLGAYREAIDRCANGIDEDSDGFVDCADWDCHWNPVLQPRAVSPDTEEQGFCQGWILNITSGQWMPQDPAMYARGVPVPLLCR